jgi:hypothetical protein
MYNPILYFYFTLNKTSNAHINVTFRRVRVTTVAVEKQSKYYILCGCACSVSHLPSNAHAPYYIVICGLSTALFNITT